MKSALYILLSIGLLYSCGDNSSDQDEKDEKIENEGNVKVKNGKGETIEIPYNCVGCNEELKSRSEFDVIIKEANKQFRERMKYPRSFIPVDFDINLISNDSLYYYDSGKKIKNVFEVAVDANYIAKNGYGNELEGDGSVHFYVKDGKVVDLSEQIKLEPLKFDNSGINRSLSLFSSDGNDQIEILPTKEKRLIVSSTLTCVDEGTWLVLKLENSKEVKLVSWNDFNCDGTSYYWPFNEEQIALIKENKVNTIMVLDDDAIGVAVPENERDYFQQLVKL